MIMQITLLKNFISFSLIIIILSSFELKSQTFTEIEEFYENGQTKIEIIKNNDLIIIQKNEFDINGELIEFYKYDPTTGLRDGDFLQGSNKGFYTQGEINCKNCKIILNENSYGKRISLRGNFSNGKPNGLIDIYVMSERQNLQRNPYTSYLLSREIGERINYSTRVGTGVYDKTKLMTLNYDKDGYLDGEQFISEYTKLNYKNGILIEVLSKNRKNPSVYKDSISRNNKIWKINNKYYKNLGWLKKLYWPQYSGNTDVIIEYPIDGDGIIDPRKNFNVFFGNQNTKYVAWAPSVGIDYGGFGELNKNGIYERIDDLSSIQTFKEHYNFADLFFKVPLNLKYISTTPSDVNINGILRSARGEDLKNNKTLLFKKELEDFFKSKTRNTISFYKIMQSVIDSDYTPFIRVYLSQGGNYETYREAHKVNVREHQRIEEEALRREEEALKLKERVKKDIEKADLEFVINNYLSFLGEDEKVNNFAHKSSFQKWKLNYKNIHSYTSITKKPKGFLKYETIYGTAKKVILIDGNSKKGYLYTNSSKRKKLDEKTINNLTENLCIIPEINYLKNSKYEGVDFIKNEHNIEEQAYKIRINSNAIIYYSVKDFRKIVRVNVDGTKSYYSAWKNFKGVKFPHEIILNPSAKEENLKGKELLIDFKLDPILENNYFTKKIKFKRKPNQKGSSSEILWIIIYSALAIFVLGTL